LRLWILSGVFFILYGIVIDFARVFTLLLISIATFAIHNRFNSRANTLALILAGIGVSYLLIKTPMDLAVFLVGSIFGYVSDFLGVYTKKWRYNTPDGYCWWVGIGWGIFSLYIFRLQEASTFFVGMLLCISLVFLFVTKKARPPETMGEVFNFCLMMAAFFFYPTVVGLSFTLGICVEYVAVELFHTWTYRNTSYLQLGTGYTIMLVAILYIAGSFFSLPPVSHLLLICTIPVYFVLRTVVELLHGRRNLLTPKP
jgi:hypothetical protein